MKLINFCKSNVFLIWLLLSFVFIVLVFGVLRYKEHNELYNLKVEFLKTVQNSIEKEVKEQKIKDKDGKYINYNIENNITIPNIDKNTKDFLEKYYSSQSNWLNFWLTVLTIVVSMIAVVMPFLFSKRWEKEKSEYDNIKSKIEIMLEQADKEMKRLNIKKASKEIEDLVFNKSRELNDDLNQITDEAWASLDERKELLAESLKKSIIDEAKVELSQEISTVVDDLWLEVNNEKKKQIKQELIAEIRKELEDEK